MRNSGDMESVGTGLYDKSRRLVAFCVRLCISSTRIIPDRVRQGATRLKGLAVFLEGRSFNGCGTCGYPRLCRFAARSGQRRKLCIR